ncbi:hypothetical protein X771_31085 [Mesorhizobium sp. LSJC277A00]|nr:hypothetical protein X771_31085 [Mesorhizobium sp. LSJC277A00]
MSLDTKPVENALAYLLIRLPEGSEFTFQHRPAFEPQS